MEIDMDSDWTEVDPYGVDGLLGRQVTDWYADELLRATKPSKSVHGSDYFKCALQQYYKFTGQPISDFKFVSEYYMAARHGEAIHDMVQQEFVREKRVVRIRPWDEKNPKHLEARRHYEKVPAIEVEFNAASLEPEYEAQREAAFAGIRADAQIRMEPGGEEIWVEIKSVDNSYIDGEKKDDLVRWKVPDFARQLLPIMHLGHLQDSEVGLAPYGMVLVVSRQQPTKRRQFMVPYNVHWGIEAILRMKLLAHHFKEKIKPEPEPGQDCSSCHYFTQCPSNRRRKSFLEPFPPTPGPNTKNPDEPGQVEGAAPAL
jgi:hypothetical protein